MGALLVLLAIISLLAGVGLLFVSYTIFMEIAGLMFFVVAAVLISGGAVVDAVHKLRKEIASKE